MYYFWNRETIETFRNGATFDNVVKKIAICPPKQKNETYSV